MNLQSYLEKLPRGGKAKFAERLELSPAYLYSLSRGIKPIPARLAVEIEKATGGAVTCEEMTPVVDWAFVRGHSQPVAMGGTSE